MGTTSDRISAEIEQKIEKLKRRHPMYIRQELDEWRELLWTGASIASGAITDEVTGRKFS